MEKSLNTRSVSGIGAGRRTVIGALAMIAALLSWFPPSASAQEKAPVEVVAAYQEVIVEAAKKSDFDARYEALEPAVREAYDLPYIARRSIGSQNWDALSEEQQQKFAETYARFSIATHASRFSEYRGDGFRQVETKDMPRGYKLVRTELQRNRLDDVVISYLMQERDGRWQIVDVFLQGTISEVATRKAEFTTVIRDKGFDALVNLLEQRIQDARGAS